VRQSGEANTAVRTSGIGSGWYRPSVSGTETIVGSLVRSSHALEYNESEFGRTATFMSPIWNAAMLANVLFGAWMRSVLATLVCCFRLRPVVTI
jgi:hypothetical protein